MVTKLTLINNYQLLDLLGLIEPVGDCVKLSDRAYVLKDDIPIQSLPNSKTFTLDKILNEKVFKKEELWTTLQNLPYLKHLRVFFAKFRSDQNGRVSRKADMWDQIKAWRYDIDVVKDEDLVNEREKAIQKINNKVKDIQELIQKLPLPPNLIKRSNKGWHLIYVLKEFITRDAYETYIKHYNNPKLINKDDDIADQFIAYELLSKYISKYLAELEPLLDFQASSIVSSIATRFITEELPAYLIREPYSLKDLRKAFEYMLMDNTEEDVVYKQGKTPYTVKDIPKNTFLSLMDRCGVLKALDEDWENHTEYEWYVMTNYYAIKILYAETPEEEEEIRQEFHEKSSRWRGNGNKHYTYNEADRQLQYYIRKQEEGLKPPTCKYIYNNLSSKYTTICHSCPYRRFDTKGNIISNFIFDGLKSDSLEDITIPGWELRNDGWYMELSDEKDKNSPPVWIKVLPYFKIRAHYLVGDDDVELLDMVDKRGISAIKKVERRKDTYLVSPDLVKSYGFINPNWVSTSKKFLTYYIEKVKEQRGVKINFLGYRFINGFWDIAVGGNGNYRRKDLGYIFYGQEINEHWFIPSIQGRLETFRDIYYHAFLLNDPALHLSIAHYLSWIGLQFIDSRSVKANINPILILLGDTGTGKTVRAKIAAGLYGNPALFSFTNVTQASFNNRFPLIKCPFGIDEVMTKSQRDEEKLGELLYNIGNKNGKMTSFATHNPIDVPVILTGETENLLVDKLFSTYRGLNRRSIVIKMTTEYKDNSDTLDYLLDELYSNYGHILAYVKRLTTEDREVIEEEAKKIYDWLRFGDSSFKELRKHLALSLAMFKHFYESFVGFSSSEIEEKVNTVIEFIGKNVAENQLHKIGDTINYVDEVLEFITSVKKAEKEGYELYGLGYKSVISKISYKPSDKVGEVLKKFFWKKYSYKNGTNYEFKRKSLLLAWPDIQPIEFSVEADRMLQEFTEDDMSIWIKVAEVRFGKPYVYTLLRELIRLPVTGKELVKKFPELKTILHVEQDSLN